MRMLASDAENVFVLETDIFRVRECAHSGGYCMVEVIHGSACVIVSTTVKF